VGGKAPNAWGLYDMHGNVLEWCADPWLPGYKDAPGDGHLARMGSGPARVLRGGSWTTSSLNARAACRHRGMEGSRRDDRGLRVALWLERK